MEASDVYDNDDLAQDELTPDDLAHDELSHDDLASDELSPDDQSAAAASKKSKDRTKSKQNRTDDDPDDDHDEDLEPEPEDQEPTTNASRHLEYLRPDITRIVVVPSITTEILSEYEMPQSNIIRGSQIEKTGIHYILRPHDNIDTAEDLARAELMDRRCPLILRRKRGEKYFYDADGKLVCEQYVEDLDPNKLMFSRAYE